MTGTRQEHTYTPHPASPFPRSIYPFASIANASMEERRRRGWGEGVCWVTGTHHPSQPNAIQSNPPAALLTRMVGGCGSERGGMCDLRRGRVNGCMNIIPTLPLPPHSEIRKEERGRKATRERRGRGFRSSLHMYRSIRLTDWGIYIHDGN